MTPAQVLALIASDLPDNTSGLITPAILRNVLDQMVGALATPASVTITVTPSTISAAVNEVFFNVGSAAVSTLPDAAAWLAANLGLPLLLKDITGNAGTNNITINAAGANTIDGLTGITITSGYGFFSLRVISNNWVTVG